MAPQDREDPQEFINGLSKSPHSPVLKNSKYEYFDYYIIVNYVIYYDFL